jgi:hypothetical protein
MNSDRFGADPYLSGEGAFETITGTVRIHNGVDILLRKNPKQACKARGYRVSVDLLFGTFDNEPPSNGKTFCEQSFFGIQVFI